MGADPAILVEGLWKRYGLPLAARAARAGARCRALLPWPGRPVAPRGLPWSLSDVNLRVEPGESLGVIGRNGAGKSTLLKVLAGVTPPSRGRVAVAGRIFPMIELNAGIHRDLTGRENAELLGAIMGFDRRGIRARMPEIEAFCELGEWFERPARQYSSGMLARLGFGVAMNVESDVVLVDEVLSVGDFAFQKKCINRMSRLSSEGTTVVFVSHNPYLVERMCDRVVVLRDGRLEELAEPAEAIHHYYRMNAPESEFRPPASGALDDRPGSGDLRIRALEVLDARGRSGELETGEPATLRLHYEAREAVCEPNFGIRIFDAQNTMVISLAATRERAGARIEGVGTVECAIPALPLMPGVFTVQVKVSGDVLLDMLENAAFFSVHAPDAVLVESANMGLVHVRGEWKFQ